MCFDIWFELGLNMHFYDILEYYHLIDWYICTKRIYIYKTFLHSIICEFTLGTLL